MTATGDTPQPIVPPAPKKRGGGCLKWGAIIGGVLVVLLIITAVATSGNKTATATATPAAQAAAAPVATTAAQPTAAAAAAAAAATKPAEATKPAAEATKPAAPTVAAVATKPAAPTAAPKPAADVNHGIVFGKPVRISANHAAVLVTNTSAQVKGFFAKATYKKGDTILTTASGAVNDLPPGQKRAASLLSSSPIPAEFDTVRVDIDVMTVEAATTAGATAASKITFGKPNVKKGALSTVEVEVMNGDTATHGFFVGATFLKGGELVAVASGAVNDLAAAQTKTATLLSSGGQLPDYDEVLLSIDVVTT